MLVCVPQLEDLLSFHPPEGKLHMVQLLDVVLFLVLELLQFYGVLLNKTLEELDL